MKEEIWSPINGWEGLYDVSNLGRIRSCEKIIKKDGENIIKKEAVISRITVGKWGYGSKTAFRNNKKTTLKVHRVVAEAFIPNPENKPCVNHINGNKMDNRVENLEWCTYSENAYHAYQLGLRRGQRGVYSSKKSIGCIQLDSDGNKIAVFKSRNEAERKTGIPSCNIAYCINGKYKQAGGYVWINS